MEWQLKASILSIGEVRLNICHESTKE